MARQRESLKKNEELFLCSLNTHRHTENEIKIYGILTADRRQIANDERAENVRGKYEMFALTMFKFDGKIGKIGNATTKRSIQQTKSNDETKRKHET